MQTAISPMCILVAKGVYQMADLHKYRVCKSFEQRNAQPATRHISSRKTKIYTIYFCSRRCFSIITKYNEPFSGHQERGSMQHIFNYRLSRARKVLRMYLVNWHRYFVFSKIYTTRTIKSRKNCGILGLITSVLAPKCRINK
nr:unnamed protein product [Callosobruchus analis]